MFHIVCRNWHPFLLRNILTDVHNQYPLFLILLKYINGLKKQVLRSKIIWQKNDFSLFPLYPWYYWKRISSIYRLGIFEYLCLLWNNRIRSNSDDNEHRTCSVIISLKTRLQFGIQVLMLVISLSFFWRTFLFKYGFVGMLCRNFKFSFFLMGIYPFFFGIERIYRFVSQYQ